MVVVPLQTSISVGGRCTVYQNVVGSLYGEGLLDLGVWREDEMDQDCQGYEEF